MKVLGIRIDGDQLEAMDRAMRHELEDPRGFTWYNHVAARAVVYEGFPAICVDGASIAAHVAARLLKRAARAGRVRHIGGGKWQPVVS